MPASLIQWQSTSDEFRLKVVIQGDRFTFYYNDSLLDEATIEMPGEGSVGIAVAVGNDGWTNSTFTGFGVDE